MAETDKERLLAYLADAREKAAEADNQIERQQTLIEDLRAAGPCGLALAHPRRVLCVRASSGSAFRCRLLDAPLLSRFRIAVVSLLLASSL